MSDTTRIMINTRLDPGVQLNDTYEIDERIASGGMGEVYRGHNIQTGEPVAIKAILPELADKEAITALFKREATTLGRLHHDTIVRYYSFSRDPRLGRTYLAMEFVEGVSLADRISQVPLTPDEVRKLFAKVADGLALAHEAKVIHRDLSPDNIILRGGNVGRPTIIDFGIARNANVGEGTLIGGGFAGKFNFVSPEQLGIHNREVDARSDIYSLGLVIAAALRGDPLDMGGSHVEVIEKRSRLPDLSGIDESLRPLVEAMLQPNPDDRPADATVVADWLRATTNNGQTAAPVNGGFVASTGGPGLTFPTQPGIVAGQTGAPFAASQSSAAASNPTQLIAPSASPFSPARPPSGSGESPFGTAPAQAAAALIGSPATQPPGGPSPVVTATQSKSGIGRYAIAGGVLLLLAAGGGAYTTGLIGPKGGDSDGKGTVEQTDRDTNVTKDGTTNQETVKDGAKSAEHDNIGKAIEETLGSDGIAGAGDTKTSNTDSGGIKTESGGTTGAGSSGSEGSTTGTDGTKTTTAGGTDGTEATGGGKIETVSGDGSQGSGTQTTGDGTGGTETIGTNNTGGGEVTGPDNGTQETTTGLTKMVDVGVAWLRHYDGGPCFFIAVTSVTDKTLMAKGFGLDTPAFQKLYNSFRSTNDFDPVINGHPIRQPQCAAVDFLKAVQPGTHDNPQLQIASDTLKTGDTLNVSVDKIGDRKLDLLLVDAEGFVHNMKSFAKETDADGKSTFDIKMGGNKLDPDSPQMVIALTSPSGLAVPEGTKQVAATELFPRLGREVEVMKSNVGIDFGYFLLSP